VSRWLQTADFSTLKMEAIVPPKRRFTQDLHGATSQKTTFFLVTAVKTSDLTKLILIYVYVGTVCGITSLRIYRFKTKFML
jgi:hypothetical protein